MESFIERKNYQFDKTHIKLDSLSFERVLDRGFALVINSEQQPVFSSSAIQINSAITVKFRDGNVQALVKSKKNKDSGS